MRILLASQYFRPDDFRVTDLVEDLLRCGHEVRVMTGQPGYPDRGRFPGHGRVGPSSQRWRGVHGDRVPLLSLGDRHGCRLALNYLSFAVSATILGRAGALPPRRHLHLPAVHRAVVRWGGRA